jgi:hypothetical protein
LSAESLEILPISGAQFRTATRFADQYALGLRLRARMFHIGAYATGASTFVIQSIIAAIYALLRPSEKSSLGW